MPQPLLDFLTWSGWQHIGTVALLASALPAIALPFTYAYSGSWRTTLAARSLMWLYAGIAGVYLYLIGTAVFGTDYPGRTLVRFAVFMPFGYGVWRMWFTHFRYARQGGVRGPQMTNKKWQTDADVGVDPTLDSEDVA